MRSLLFSELAAYPIAFLSDTLGKISMNSSIPLLMAILIVQLQLTTCKWTFSLRINSTDCCRTPSCDDIGSCDDLILVVCLRLLGTSILWRSNCGFFIGGNTTELLNREITTQDGIDGRFDPKPTSYVDYDYEGGVQLLIAIITEMDIPALSDDIIIYEYFVNITRSVGGGECPPVTLSGEGGTVTVSLTVECYDGYGGEDCACIETEMSCDPNTFTTPTPSSSMIPPSQSTDEPTENSLLLPAGAGLGGFVAVLLLLIALFGLCLLYRRRRDKKSKRLDLWKLNEDIPRTAPHNEVEITPQNEPLKFTIPPNDVMDDGVTYTTVLQSESNGHHNMEYGEEFEENKMENGESTLVYADLDHDTRPLQPEKGLVYADIVHERATTFSTFKKKFSGRRRKPPKPPSPPPADITEGNIEYSTIQREPSHKYMNVGTSPKPKPRSDVPREENKYSTVPRSSGD